MNTEINTPNATPSKVFYVIRRIVSALVANSWQSSGRYATAEGNWTDDIKYAAQFPSIATEPFASRLRLAISASNEGVDVARVEETKTPGKVTVDETNYADLKGPFVIEVWASSQSSNGERCFLTEDGGGLFYGGPYKFPLSKLHAQFATVGEALTALGRMKLSGCITRVLGIRQVRTSEGPVKITETVLA